MSEFIIEEITKENSHALTKLMVEWWSDSSFEEHYTECESILSDGNQTCYLIKVNERHVGFIHLTLRSDYVEGATSSPTAYIEGVYVQNDYRNRGLGNQLLLVAESWTKQKGCNQLASDTELENLDSIEFHRKAGFEIANRVVCLIKDVK